MQIKWEPLQQSRVSITLQGPPRVTEVTGKPPVSIREHRTSEDFRASQICTSGANTFDCCPVIFPFKHTIFPQPCSQLTLLRELTLPLPESPPKLPALFPSTAQR